MIKITALSFVAEALVPQFLEPFFDLPGRTLVASAKHHSVEGFFFDPAPTEDAVRYQLELFGEGFRYDDGDTLGSPTRIAGTVDQAIFMRELRLGEERSARLEAICLYEFEPGVADPFDPAIYRQGIVLIGNRFGNSLGGDDGPDRLRGREGDDMLAGRAGSDRLIAGDGDDELHGGGGKDFLAGGPGSDTFRFERPSDAGVGRTRDVIYVFEIGSDRLDLSDMWSTSPRLDRVDPGFKFIGDESFSGTPGELRYSNGVVAADRDGDRRSDFQIEIDNAAPLTEADILL